jgi:hypothetical protein
VQKYGTPAQATDDNIMRSMRCARWLNKATDTRSHNVLNKATDTRSHNVLNKATDTRSHNVLNKATDTRSHNVYFFHGSTAPRGPSPPHC